MRVVLKGWTAGCLAALVLAAPALAQPDARQRLEQAAFVIREARSLSFKTEAYNEKSVFPLEIRTFLTVHMRRPAEEGAGTWDVRYSGRVTGLEGAGAGDGDSMELQLLREGRYLTWVDHQKKKVYSRAARVARGTVVNMMQFGAPFVESLSAGDPYAEELNAGELSLEGTAEIDGVTCDIVQVRDPERDLATRWYFAQSDHLPRRYETILGDMQMHTVCDIREWKINPELDDSIFELKTPEGYDRLDSRPRRVNPTERDVGPTPRSPRNPVGTDVGDRAPSWELARPGGERVSLESLRGKVVVIDFFGSWCIPAEDAAPHLQKLTEHFESRPVEVFALACKEPSPEAPRRWMEDMGVTYSLLLDADEVAERYRVRQYPTRYVIGFNGEILHASQGFKTDENPFPEITKLIEDYLRNQPVEEPAPASPRRPGRAGPGDGEGGRDDG